MILPHSRLAAKPHILARPYIVKPRQTPIVRAIYQAIPYQSSAAGRGDGCPHAAPFALEAESSHFPRHYFRRSRRNGRNYNTDVNNWGEWTSLNGAAAGIWARGWCLISGPPAATLTTAAPPAQPVQFSPAHHPFPSLLLSRCLTRIWNRLAVHLCTWKGGA